MLQYRTLRLPRRSRSWGRRTWSITSTVGALRR
jgi:hypothetical protein